MDQPNVMCGHFFNNDSEKPTIKRHFWGNLYKVNTDWVLDDIKELY